MRAARHHSSRPSFWWARQQSRPILRRTLSSSSSSVTDGPLFLYEQAIARKEIQSDDLQLAALAHLQHLHEQLRNYELPQVTDGANSEQIGESGFFSQIFGGSASEPGPEAVPASPQLKGVYLWGGVGCGKTYIMDLFYDAAPLELKSRVHFHSFMLDVHNRMHALRRGGLAEDPIPHITKELVDDSILLCFDEFVHLHQHACFLRGRRMYT